MEGACRHYLPIKDKFRGYRKIAVDSSSNMLDYGSKNYKIPKSDLKCSTVQDFDFQLYH